MRKTLPVLLLLCGMAQAQIVNIPDANFRQALVSQPTVDTDADNVPDLVVDANGDGEIQVSEALAVTGQMTLDNHGISDLTGIGAFANLQNLNCSFNSLTTLDVTTNTALEILDCSFNMIGSLSISGLQFLSTVDCSHNQLTSLDISGLPLYWLSINDNQISTIDFTGQSGLNTLECHANAFTSLDLSGLPTLWGLGFGNPGLNTVIFPNNPVIGDVFYNGGVPDAINFLALHNLTRLYLRQTQDTQLDVSGLPLLTSIKIEDCPEITFVNMKNGGLFNHVTDDSGVNFNFCPNLQYVCTNDADAEFVTTVLSGINGVGQAGSYCSFTPGGDYNTITGTARFDGNQDGCDISDAQIANMRVDINDGTASGATFTQANGSYAFYTAAGNFTLSPSLEIPAYFNISPVTAPVAFPDANNNTAVLDFCVSASGVHHDVEVVVAPIGLASPVQDVVSEIVIRNKGNQTESGSFSMTYDSSKLDFLFTDSAPAVQASGSASWNFSALAPFESRVVKVSFHLHNDGDPQPANIGDILHFAAAIDPANTDEMPSDNNFTYDQTVVDSYDPNEIKCLEGPVASASEIGDFLHYMVNFENTGTDVAGNVVVRIDINPAFYDIGSLQLLSASDNCYARITGNRVEFIFQGIDLAAADTTPVGGHGNVLFKIKSNAALSVGDTVSKTADIFFDYNAPVVTNVAETTFQTLGIPENDHIQIRIAPNPASSAVSITSRAPIEKIELFDTLGRILEVAYPSAASYLLDVSRRPKGIYFIRMATALGVLTEKIIRE